MNDRSDWDFRENSLWQHGAANGLGILRLYVAPSLRHVAQDDRIEQYCRGRLLLRDAGRSGAGPIRDAERTTASIVGDDAADGTATLPGVQARYEPRSAHVSGIAYANAAAIAFAHIDRKPRNGCSSDQPIR